MRNKDLIILERHHRVNTIFQSITCVAEVMELLSR